MATQLATAASGILRDRHYQRNPVTGLFERCVLLEAARTNSLLRSQEFDNAAWAKTNVTVTPNAVLAPDGTLTADKVAATATAGTVLNQVVIADGTSVTYSIYAKKGSGATDAARFGIYNNTTVIDLLFITFDYDTGAITYTTGATGASVETLADGWYRITLTVTAGVTAGNSLAVYGGFSGGVVTAGLYAYVWGAQVESAAFASSYIATTSAAVTRAADALSLPFTAAPQEMTMYARFFERGTVLMTASEGLLGVGASSSPTFSILNTATGFYTARHFRVGDRYSSPGVAPAIGDLVELRAILYADGSVQLGQSINGGGEVLAARSAAEPLATAWFDTTLTLNSRGSATSGFVAFTAVKQLAGVQTLATMRTL